MSTSSRRMGAGARSTNRARSMQTESISGLLQSGRSSARAIHSVDVCVRPPQRSTSAQKEKVSLYVPDPDNPAVGTTVGWRWFLRLTVRVGQSALWGTGRTRAADPGRTLADRKPWRWTRHPVTIWIYVDTRDELGPGASQGPLRAAAVSLKLVRLDVRRARTRKKAGVTGCVRLGMRHSRGR